MSTGASIVAAFGGDVSGLKGAAKEADMSIGTLASQISKKFEFKDLGRTMATALGINIEKISESIARVVTGISATEEEAFKQLATVSDQVAAANMANMQSRLTDEQKLQQVLLLRERVEARIANNLGRTTAQLLQQKQDELALTNAIAEATKLTADIEGKRAKQANDDLDRMTKFKEQIAEADKRTAEKAIVDQKRLNEETASAVNKSLTLDEQINEQRVARLPIEQQLVEREKEKAELLATQKTTVKGSNDYKELQIKINEKDNQVTALGLEIAEKTKQVIKEQGEEIISNTAKWEEFKVAVTTTGRGNTELSDRELARKASIIKADISTRSAAASTTATGYDPFLEAQRANLMQLVAEQDFRSSVRRAAFAFGEDRAFNQFPGLTEARFTEILRGATDNEKTIKVLTQINETQKQGFQTLGQQLLTVAQQQP